MSTKETQAVKKQGKEQFSSIFGFLMVAIGFAVGVGSLWRFPYVCGANGGAVFIFAYLIIILAIGIPLLTAEISMGFSTKETPLGAYKQLAPGKKWYMNGYLHLAAALFIFSYTVPIYAYILNYLYRTIIGFFDGMNSGQITQYFGEFTADYSQLFIFAIVNWALVALVVRGGLQGGVEKIAKFLLPLLAIIMVVIIIAGLRLEGAVAGVEFLLKPDFSKFTFESLLTALGQAFFAVGIGMLASMVFGSYIGNPKENIGKSASVICTAIIFAGVAAGFMIFPMVFAFGLEPAAGPGLTFITLPNAFNQIAGGRIIGSLFYFGFYIAAFTSAIGILEAVVGTIRDKLNISRNKALALSMSIAVVIGIPSILSSPFFNAIDLVTNNYIIVVGAFILSIFVGWIWGIDNFINATNIKSNFARTWIKICVKFVSPIVILVIFAAQFF